MQSATNLDLAINGNGFFQVKATNGQVLYSRNGAITQDRNGYLINSQQSQLLGYVADSAGNIVPGTPVPIKLPTGGINPQATATINLEGNLDSTAGVTLPADPPVFEGMPLRAAVRLLGAFAAMLLRFPRAAR